MRLLRRVACATWMVDMPITNEANSIGAILGHKAPVRTMRARTTIGSRASAAGQALILTIITLLVLCLGLLMLFDTGQAVSKKVQLVNAADAAAYSVAIEQARALNTVAYLNRAEIANQIAIAQIVSLQSYGNYADSMAGRVANLLFFAGDFLDWAGVGEVLQSTAETIKGVQQGYAGALVAANKAESLLVSGLNTLNGIYSAGQSLVLDAFSIQAGATTANKVIHDNTLDADGQSHATMSDAGTTLLVTQLICFDGSKLCKGPSILTGNKGYANRYTIPQSNGPGKVQRTWEADRYANVVMQARDNFSERRNGHIPIAPFPFVSIDANKLGGTDLVDYNRWVAVDDLGISVKLGICPWLCKKINGATLAIGAAAALPGDMNTSNSSTIISPGISLTKSSGTQARYNPGTGKGWYSPYNNQLSAPYQGALGNVSIGADAAANPSDQNNHDWVADLGIETGWPDVVPSDATPQNAVWIISKAPEKSTPIFQIHSSGLQDYNDVAPDKAIEPYQTASSDKSDVGPIFTVHVQQVTSTVRTGSTIGMEAGDLKLKDQGLNDAIAAISTAQVYYSRPLDLLGLGNDQRELGNLFEPYWQVRLVDTPAPIKAILLGSQWAGM